MVCPNAPDTCTGTGIELALPDCVNLTATVSETSTVNVGIQVNDEVGVVEVVLVDASVDVGFGVDEEDAEGEISAWSIGKSSVSFHIVTVSQHSSKP